MIRNKIKKKLRSKQGTSIFFGLLLFLIASILSTVMLSASVTAVKSVESDRKTEQSYLTCSSAAKMLRDAIENIKIEKKTTTTIVGTQTTEDVKWSKMVQNTAKATDQIADFLLDYVKNYNKNGALNPSAATQTCVISVPTNDAGGSDKVEDVTARCTLSTGNDRKGYTIVIKLTTGEGINACQMVVKLSGSADEVKDLIREEWVGSGTDGHKETVTTTTLTYSWTATDTIYGDQERNSEAS